MSNASPAVIIGFILAFMACCFIAAHLLQRSPRQPGRNEQLIARHRQINRRHLGEDGFTFTQVLGLLGFVIGGHMLLVCFYLIICAVFGAQEPQW